MKTALQTALQRLPNFKSFPRLQGINMPFRPLQAIDSILSKRFYYLRFLYSNAHTVDETRLSSLLQRATHEPIHLLAAGEKAAYLGIYANRRLLFRGPMATAFFWNGPLEATAFLWERAGAVCWFPGDLAEQTISAQDEPDAVSKSIARYEDSVLATAPGLYFHFVGADLRVLAELPDPLPVSPGSVRRGHARRLWALWQHFWVDRLASVWVLDWESPQVLYRRKASHVEPSFHWPGVAGRVTLREVGPLRARPAWVYALDRLKGSV